jgi:hypothetical protein
LLAVAGAVALLALLSRGPIGLVRCVAPRVHRMFDLGIIAALALLPVALTSGRSLTSILVSEIAAVAMARLAWGTRYRAPSMSPARPVAVQPAPVPAPISIARSLGRATGRRRASALPAQRVVDTTARRLGQVVARLGRKLDSR